MDKKSYIMIAAAALLSAGLCMKGYADTVTSGDGTVTAIVEASGTVDETTEAAVSETQSAVSSTGTAIVDTTVESQAATGTSAVASNGTAATAESVNANQTTALDGVQTVMETAGTNQTSGSTGATQAADTTVQTAETSSGQTMTQTAGVTSSTPGPVAQTGTAATNGTSEFGPMSGTDTSQMASAAGDVSVPGANASAEAGSTVSVDANVYADGLHDTLPLPVGFHFNNIATYTYQNMVDDLTVLKAQYPEMKMDVLGTTADNRSLYHVVVGNPNAKHKILVHAGIHAREYIVSQLCMREIASLLEMQKKATTYKGCSVPQLLETTCIHFVPMVDPDGITLVQGGINALQTAAAKTSVLTIAGLDGATDMGTYLRTWKNNINGVNLNRNFDANWSEAAAKVDHPSSMNYKGSAPESEIESKVLADLTRTIMPDRTISYHTQGKVIYWYFGETGTYKNEGLNLATIVHNNSGYSISNSWSEKDAAGYKDWAVQKLDIPSVTIECGIGTSPVPEEQIESMWSRNDGILPDVLVDLLYK